MNKNKIHIAWYSSNISEGGIARNFAIASSLKEFGYYTINMYPNNLFIRFINIPRLIYLLFFLKDKKVVIHGNYFITNLLVQIFHFKFYIWLLNKLILRFISRNDLVIEINDLRFEQTRDLKGYYLSDKFLNAEFKLIYAHKDLNVKYIFASNCMRDYAVKKYNLNYDSTSVLINGGPKTVSTISESKPDLSRRIKCVYAGTLNRGRQIESMLDLFKQRVEMDLLLIGIGGEWINRYEIGSNIKYLGSLDESEAHKLVSKCDLGLIPYSSEKEYYNICYPTKASFYITANIPFLSTKTTELLYNFENMNICIFSDFENWSSLLSELSLDHVKEMKDNLLRISTEYTWRNLLIKSNLI